MQLHTGQCTFLGLAYPFGLSERGEYLLPRLRMSTPLLAEEGTIPIREDAKLRLEVRNLSRMLKMKLKIALQLVN